MTDDRRDILNPFYQPHNRIENLTMSQSCTNLIYHLIFSTKDRRPLITLDYQPRLYEYIGSPWFSGVSTTEHKVRRALPLPLALICRAVGAQ